MHEARVLVVDDSAAMRALFSDVLEQSRNVRVVGSAANAAEARRQIAELRPNVLTLDVEMPGMSGIEFLEEVMSEAPMPVVMLSSLTQSGTETSLKAYELGAVECFPKPMKATPEQFAKTVAKLGKIVLAAANSNVRERRVHHREPRAGQAPFAWNGHYAALSASMGGIDALGAILAEWPAQCPPTVIVLQTEPELARTFIARLDAALKCSVREASDGAVMTPGHVYIAADPSRHVVFEPGQPARLRLIDRDPVDGARPSATLLFAALARAAVPAVGAVLTGMGEDGARGLRLMRDAGCDTMVEQAATATVGEAPAAALAAGAAQREVALADLDKAVLDCCNIA